MLLSLWWSPLNEDVWNMNVKKTGISTINHTVLYAKNYSKRVSVTFLHTAA